MFPGIVPGNQSYSSWFGIILAPGARVRRISEDEGIVRNALYDYCTRRNDGAATNADTFKDRGVVADPDVIVDDDGLYVDMWTHLAISHGRERYTVCDST